ncbi:MAG: SDR family NAD(P)-dependent oxidoreductase [Gammaproteobacteria bacterium]
MTLALNGKAAIVTGVSSGVGEGIAEALASAGARVAGIARRADRGEALAARIRAAGGDCTFLAADLADRADCERVVAEAQARLGRIDILVNNAATKCDLLATELHAPEEWDRVVDMNLSSVFRMCRLVLPGMRARRDGVIINIASINAVFGNMYMAPYNAAKAGVVNLTRTIAAEAVADGVRANAIILGGVPSEMNLAFAAETAAMVKGHPVQPTPEQIAAFNAAQMPALDVGRALALLCTDAARLITGSEIAIDGALTCGFGLSQFIIGASTAALG